MSQSVRHQNLPIVVECSQEVSAIVELGVLHQKGAAGWEEQFVLVCECFHECILNVSEVVLEAVVDAGTDVIRICVPINGPIDPRRLGLTTGCACVRPVGVRHSGNLKPSVIDDAKRKVEVPVGRDEEAIVENGQYNKKCGDKER
jgi:hypothetical protein